MDLCNTMKYDRFGGGITLFFEKQCELFSLLKCFSHQESFKYLWFDSKCRAAIPRLPTLNGNYLSTF